MNPVSQMLTVVLGILGILTLVYVLALNDDV